MLINWSDSIKKIIITNKEVTLKINVLNLFLEFKELITFKHKIKKVKANILKKKNLNETKWSLNKAWGSKL